MNNKKTENCFKIEGKTTYLTITSGVHGVHVASFSTVDMQKVELFKWGIGKYGNGLYVKTRNKENGNSLFFHRLVTGFKWKIVDHVDGNTLNNVRENLREATMGQNNRNSRIQKNNGTGYKGVARPRRYQRFEARICVNYKSIFLGSFDTAKEAAIAYNNAAIKYYGEFARLNEVA